MNLKMKLKMLRTIRQQRKEETIEQWARRTGQVERIAALYKPTDQLPGWMHEPTPPSLGNKQIADLFDMYMWDDEDGHGHYNPEAERS